MSKEKTSKVADTSMIDIARAFLDSKLKVDDATGVSSVNTKDITTFYEQQGIPMAVQNKITSIGDSLNAASIDILGEKVLKEVDECKKKGTSPDEVSQTIILHYPTGRETISMDSHTTRKIPTHLPTVQNKSGGEEFSHHYGAVTIRTSNKRMLAPRKEQLEDWASKIKSAYGI